MPDSEPPLYYEQLGKFGPPFAFVHPNPFDRSCWLYQMAHLSTWFRTIGIDLPGYGRSPAFPSGLTMPKIAGWCWDAVDAVSSEPAVLCGLSVGFNIVLHMAVLRPEQTKAVILSGCSYRPVKQFAQKRIAQYSEQGIAFRAGHAMEDFSPAFRETELGRYFQRMFVERNQWADAPTIVEMFRALGEPDPDWLFERQAAPMLIVTGSEDNSHPDSFALQKRIAGCELVTIQGAGHACNMEKPWEFDQHVLDFLSRRGLAEL
ncbi:MAG TPA: alpha/beta hydrolase [Chloroflexota bacterium]|nr:alpha/beta hydrolase [Chloroflexota bacterium]